jgi:hypothetical protein
MTCPKCRGVDYFLGKRNVSGAFLKILRTKQVPICKVCDEIMVSPLSTLTPEERRKYANAQFKSANLWKQVAYIMVAFLIILIPLIIYLS